MKGKFDFPNNIKPITTKCTEHVLVMLKCRTDLLSSFRGIPSIAAC